MEKNVRVEPLLEREMAPKNKKTKAPATKKSDHKHNNIVGIILYKENQRQNLYAIVCEYCSICGKIRTFKFCSKEVVDKFGPASMFVNDASEILKMYPDLPVFLYTEHYSPVFRIKNISEVKKVNRDLL